MYRINASYLCSDIIDVEMVAKQQSKTKPKYSFRNNENYPHHIITIPTSSEVSEITIKFDSNDVIEKITSKKNQQLSNNKKRTVLNHNSLDSPPNKKLDENDHTECLTNEFPTPKNCRDEIIAAGKNHSVYSYLCIFLFVPYYSFLMLLTRFWSTAAEEYRCYCYRWSGHCYC